MPWILADDTNYAMAADDLAIAAYFFYRSPDFHFTSPTSSGSARRGWHRFSRCYPL